jgi:hypothetical protein
MREMVMLFHWLLYNTLLMFGKSLGKLNKKGLPLHKKKARLIIAKGFTILLYPPHPSSTIFEL